MVTYLSSISKRSPLSQTPPHLLPDNGLRGMEDMLTLD